ncbi:MAG: hypothetical protein KAY32_03580 [Candidatus Eisenbacteria sp.]|nr:hypothetical protein [Candidatus Eisenbacteria bacterium]
MRPSEHRFLGAVALVLLVSIVFQIGLVLRKPEWLTAFGTILLAVIAGAAVAREQVRDFLFPPILEADPELFEHRTHIMRRYGVDFVYSAGAHYIVCRIWNRGRSAARNAEAAIVSVTRTDLPEGRRPHKIMTPFNLNWAYHGVPTMTRIPAGTARVLTLGHITEPAKGGEVGESPVDGRSRFWLEVFAKPFSLEHGLDPGEYEIGIQLSADNCSPTTVKFQLRSSGRWNADPEKVWPGELEVKYIGIDRT